MKTEQLFMVFDVESIGLHGEGFAVGWVIINGYGVEVTQGLVSCPQDKANLDVQYDCREDRLWVGEHIPELPRGICYSCPHQVRAAFWEQFQHWQKQGALLVADCSWPVETRFLNQCVEDDRSRTWEGPYPLHDLGSILLAKGKDPLQKFPRLENELPEHNPLCDARQSARILIEALAHSTPPPEGK